MKPKGKASKAVAKTQPRAIAKGKSPAPRKAAAKSKAKAAPKAKIKATPKAKTKATLKTKAKAVLKSVARAVLKTMVKAAPKPKGKAAPKTNGRTTVVAASKTKAQSTPTPTPARKVAPRRDGTGRLDPKYARDLRALSRENHNDHEDRAFFKTPRSGDDLAEELGEEAVGAMTSGEDQSEHLTGEVVEEERGGPFVKTRGDDEFAAGTDRSNPVDATREPFPRT